MKKNGIVLGLIFVIVGLIILLKSFGLLYFSWWTIWKVWPFAFIFIGIAILPIEKMWKALFYILSIVACVATMIYVSKDSNHSTWRERFRTFLDRQDLKDLKDDILQSDQISYLGFSDSVTHVKVNAAFASGKYVVETKPYNSMLRFTFQGNSYSIALTEDGTTGFLTLYPKQWDSGKSSGKIHLYEKFNYSFTLQGEKSDLSLDAGNLKIDTLKINANEASTWNITLSTLTMETHVFINAHPEAGNITLTLPASSGYQFTTSVISDTVQWNNLQPVETGIYQSDNFKEAKSLIFIHSNTRNVVI